MRTEILTIGDSYCLRFFGSTLYLLLHYSFRLKLIAFTVSQHHYMIMFTPPVGTCNATGHNITPSIDRHSNYLKHRFEITYIITFTQLFKSCAKACIYVV